MGTRTALTERLGLAHPIIQAPMLGVTTTAMAAAVTRAGGLGMIAGANLDPDGLEGAIAAVREITDGAFGVNFFTHRPPTLDPERVARARNRVAPYYEELQIGPVPEAGPGVSPFGPAHLERLLALTPAVVSFHFGLPEAAAVEALRAAGILVMASATSTREARDLAARGVDAVIAQGWEAGGHRGTYLTEPEAARIGTMALVPQIADAVDLPVIAAGGITDGRGIAAALALGAGAAQLGTAFLLCPESKAAKPYKDAVQAALDEDTRISKAFSGGPARTVRNRFQADMAAFEDDWPDFPVLNTLTIPLRANSAKRDMPDLLALWCGQAMTLARPEPAADIVARLAGETDTVLGGLSR